ncbi:disulfide bond formation protein B [Pseudooctadecabacter sp.]|uniref:disulfide bond formation protein B n=1 Tax=Pseudooctadecabacter sp. TaxID=1966338 RepID=UPI0035C84E3B
MCLWQRWPHAAAIVIGLIAIAMPVLRLPLAVLGALAALTTAGFGLYHTGVARGWWEGPSSCSGGGGLGDLSGDALLSTDIAPVVMWSDIVWTLLGLSMANYNAFISLVLAALWITATRKQA